MRFQWAALHNRYALCKHLLEAGAEVDAKGGQSVATPMMWAIQRGHYYVVNLLLQHGADPMLMDTHGYSSLHLATFDNNLFTIVLLLHHNIPVDVPDSHGHTCLMWSAYNGFAAGVDLFLRFEASVNATDENGFTALHWSLVKGSQPCIQKLIEYGSDRFMMTSTGKTPAITAEEMKHLRIWHRALLDSGFDEEGHKKASTIPMVSLWLGQRRNLERFLFLWPFFMIWCALMILSHMVIYAAVPIALCTFYSLQWVVTWAVQWAPSDMKHMHKTVRHRPIIV